MSRLKKCVHTANRIEKPIWMASSFQMCTAGFPKLCATTSERAAATSQGHCRLSLRPLLPGGCNLGWFLNLARFLNNRIRNTWNLLQSKMVAFRTAEKKRSPRKKNSVTLVSLGTTHVRAFHWNQLDLLPSKYVLDPSAHTNHVFARKNVIILCPSQEKKNGTLLCLKADAR